MTCPDCGRALLPPGDVQGFPELRRSCWCGYVGPAESAKPVIKDPKLPHLDPGIQSVAIRQKEAAVQSQIVQGFKSRDYRVMETSERRRPVTCSKCGNTFVPTGGRPGISIGLGDVLVRPKVRAFQAWWKMLEVKGSETAISPAQEALAAEGDIIIVRSWAEALRAVEGELEDKR